MGGQLTIRSAVRGDAAAIAAVYAYYVHNSVITFEVEAPDTRDMAARIDHILPLYPYLVAEKDGVFAGYAYASQLYERAAYRWSAEATVYVANNHHRRGIGRELYRELFASLVKQGFKTVIGKITLPNPASVGLHEAFGFTRAGVLARVGFKHGNWYDVGLYQLDLGSRPKSPDEIRPFCNSGP